MNRRPITTRGTALKACIAFHALLQAGCATFSEHPEPVGDPEADLRSMAPLHSANTVAACMGAPTMACRNSIAAARMRAVDIRFAQFETRMFRQTREAGFGATMAALGFTSAATLANGSARAFAATAGLITSGREAFDKEMLSQQTALAIHSTMRARKASIAARLSAGLNSPLQAYSVNDSQRDLQAYEDAGSVLTALVGVNELVSDVARKAELELARTIQFKLDPSTRKLRDAVCVDGPCTALNEKKMRQLVACMADAGLPGDTLVFDLFFQPGYAAERDRVMPCMNL